ncbi:hypothetical protein KSE_05290 [Kitasatospora setae KM-6054]|uniref:Secreted protein n=1 Tax=Kitasatospora setae (strain ATCC 33774 / DSM 43861 / JCM 3304 / KCC A-0304 / NBRC 14216 / KM-6054) TaxID=452652 RepID=E4N594_KITSK|nr:hypothetical protein KSE_05290 [Kitasatospora setae KM-6054]
MLAVLLAALLHALVCAHGPLTGGATAADTLPAAAAHCAPTAVEDGTGRHTGHRAACADTDQPVTDRWQASPLTAPAELDGAAALPASAARPPSGAPRRSPAAGADSGAGAGAGGGRGRAALGTWRT